MYGPAVERAAAATDLGNPPDAAGHWAHCNGRWDDTGHEGQIWSLWVSCQYGAWSGYADGARSVSVRFNLSPSGTAYMYAGPIIGGSYSQPSAGKFRATFTRSVNGDALNTSNPGFQLGSVYYYPGEAAKVQVGTADNGGLLSMTKGTGYPPYPEDYWTGGSAGDVLDVANPTSGCSRILSMAGTEGTATFKAGNVLDQNAVDTYAWDFGDSSGTSTKRNPSYVYGSISGMPEGGWTADVTVTRTPNSGHLFTDGSGDPKTVECSLRVDFLNPDQSVPESETTTEEDTDCPTGWGWLNPLAIVNILKCLFIPTEDTETAFSGFVDEVEGSYPLGPAVWAGEVVVGVYSDFADGADEPPEETCVWGPEMDITDAGEWIEGGRPGHTGNTIPLINNCDDGPDVPAWMQTARHFFFFLSTVLMVVGFGFLILRLFGGLTSGKGDDAGSESVD